MLRIDKFGEYHFLQTTKDGYDFNKFVLESSGLLIEKAVGVLSFDGDSMNPTKEEFERGWTYDKQEVAYFYPLDENELKENIFANCYDEWYLFDKKSKLKSNHIFVTYSGFGLINPIESIS